MLKVKGAFFEGCRFRQVILKSGRRVGANAGKSAVQSKSARSPKPKLGTI